MPPASSDIGRLSIKALQISFAYVGTYKVNPDCTASNVFQDTLGNTVHTVMFIHQGANGLAIVNTDSGTTLAFNATLQ